MKKSQEFTVLIFILCPCVNVISRKCVLKILESHHKGTSPIRRSSVLDLSLTDEIFQVQFHFSTEAGLKKRNEDNDKSRDFFFCVLDFWLLTETFLGTYLSVAVGSSQILIGKQKLGVTYNSDKVSRRH